MCVFVSQSEVGTRNNSTLQHRSGADNMDLQMEESMQKLGFHSVAHMFDFMEHRDQYIDDLELKPEYIHRFTDRMYPGRRTIVSHHPRCRRLPFHTVDGTRNQSRPTRYNRTRRLSISRTNATATAAENRGNWNTSGHTLETIVSRHVDAMTESRQQLIETERNSRPSISYWQR